MAETKSNTLAVCVESTVKNGLHAVAERQRCSLANVIGSGAVTSVVVPVLP